MLRTAKKPQTKPTAAAEPPKKPLKKPAPEPEETEAETEEAEPEPKNRFKKGSNSAGKKSLADLFDSTKPSRGFPIGEFKARIVEGKLIGDIADSPDEQEKLSVQLTYEGHEDDDEVAGKTVKQFYQLANDAGEAGQGIGFFKADMDILGYEDFTLAEVEELLQQLESERPEVVIKTVQNGRFTNVYLQGLAEGE